MFFLFVVHYLKLEENTDEKLDPISEIRDILECQMLVKGPTIWLDTTEKYFFLNFN